jgi:predicted nuclease with TOPRIM domain
VGTLQTKTGQIDQLQIEQQQQVETITALQQKAAKVDDLQTQLAKVQADSAQKDQTISKLQTDLATVTKAHAQLAAQITPERLSAIEVALKKLQKPK